MQRSLESTELNHVNRIEQSLIVAQRTSTPAAVGVMKKFEIVMVWSINITRICSLSILLIRPIMVNDSVYDTQ